MSKGSLQGLVAQAVEHLPSKGEDPKLKPQYHQKKKYLTSLPIHF
jgi:hypothetical protein